MIIELLMTDNISDSIHIILHSILNICYFGKGSLQGRRRKSAVLVITHRNQLLIRVASVEDRLLLQKQTRMMSPGDG